MTARILQLSVKPRTPGEHGLPKRPVPALNVSASGAVGDYNKYRTRKLHGDPAQALLVLTEEVIAGLNAEGWPVRPGDLGENLTLSALPEAELGPGARLGSDEVVLEITGPCDPCTELHSLPYVGHAKGEAFVRTLLGRRGWYARVVTGGELRTGGDVEILKAREPA
jgi:MOSC domain-containing protein YiiM